MSRLSAWRWFALGKHPCAPDFFRVGNVFDLSRSLEEWIEAGFSRIHEKRFSLPAMKAFRFWAQGAPSGGICGGIVRDSTDKFGRPYPFLAAGTGPLPGWEQAWDLVPMALESCWQKMERLAVRSFGMLPELEAELLAWTPPAADWPRCRAAREESNRAQTACLDRFRARFRELNESAAAGRGRVLIIPVDEGPEIDAMLLFSLWHSVLKADRGGRPPQSVFLGGAPAEAALVVFQRALTTEDFQTLWSMRRPAREDSFAGNA